MHSRVADALCGAGCGLLAGLLLAAAYLLHLAGRLLGESIWRDVALWGWDAMSKAMRSALVFARAKMRLAKLR